MEKEINVVVLDIPFHEGMAGTKRVKNLMLPLYESKDIFLSNLAMISTSEKDRIGESGSINGIDYKFIGYSSAKNISSVIKFYRQGFHFINTHIDTNRKNVIYYYGYPDLKNLLFLLYAKNKNCKIIFDIVEDNRHHNDFLGFAGKVRIKTSLFLLKQIPRFGDAVIAISTTLEKWLNTMYSTKIPVYNIPITVDMMSFEDKEKNGAKTGETINIFYGGSFAPKDGLEYLLNAFNKVCKNRSDLRLILTGIGQAVNMEKVSDLIKANPKIDYMGFLSTEEYIAALKSSDICCMTRNNSLYANAGFPFKLGEFLAAGKAIIATDVGDVSLYLKNGINALLIPPESVDAIEDALLLCIDNKNGIRKKLGTEAKNTARQYFDDTILSKKLLEIFKKV